MQYAFTTGDTRTGLWNIPPLYSKINEKLSDGLVSYWTMNETGGTRYDSVGNNHLLDYNTVSQNTGILDSGADFNHNNSETLYLNTGNNLSFAHHDFSFSLWVYPRMTGGDDGLICKKDYNGGSYISEYALTLDSLTRPLYWVVSDNIEHGITCSGFVTSGQWNHIYCWYQESGNLNRGIGLMVNNVVTQVARDVNSWMTGSFIDKNLEFRIGSYQGASWTYFNGIIDEVACWNRVLSSGEVTLLYNEGAARRLNTFETSDNTYIYSSANPNSDASVMNFNRFNNSTVQKITGAKLDYVYAGFKENQSPVDLNITLAQGSGMDYVTDMWVVGITGTGIISGTLNIPPLAVSYLTGLNDLRVVFTADMHSLNSGLMAYWPLNETGGVRYDLVNNINLTDINTVSSTTGMLNNAALFNSANLEVLESRDSRLDIYDKSFAYSLWYKNDGDHGTIFGQKSGLQIPFAISRNGNAGLIFEMDHTEDAFGYIWYEYNGGITTGAWIHLYTYYNKDTSKFGVYLSGQPAYEQTITGKHDPNVSSLNYIPFAIGGQSLFSDNDKYLDCAVDEVGRWNRVLTSGEVCQLYNNGLAKKYPFGHSTLSNGLQNYWTFDETGNLKFDQINNEHLWVAGTNQLINNAILNSGFNFSGGQYLRGCRNNAVQVNSGSFTCAGWIYPTATGKSLQTIVDHYRSTNGGFSFELAVNANYFNVYLRGNDGVTLDSHTVPNNNSSSTFGHFLDRWTFFAFGFDSRNRKIFSSLSGLTTYQEDSSLSYVLNNTVEPLYLGAVGTANAEYRFSGYMDELGFWDRVLTDAEISELYNNGRGKRPFEYNNLHQGLISYWKLGESGGIRYDIVGGKHFTDNNTVQAYQDRHRYAAFIDSTQNEYLQVDDRSVVSGSFSLAFWAKRFNTMGTSAVIFSMENIYGNSILGIRYKGGTNEIQWFSWIDGNQLSIPFLSVPGPTTITGGWQFVGFSYDKDLQTGILYTQGYSREVSATGNNGSGINYNGIKLNYVVNSTGIFAINNLGLWNRPLSIADFDYIYNNGVGRNYPFL